MLLYNPSQQAYHIEEFSNTNDTSRNGYVRLGSFSRYDNALDYYKLLINNQV
ncbi:hypothetical protein [Aquimarina aggregata]|uniref:hypothetical protein n=1 Tax=Aquimarina aggregata TaxID=1642818 RepID=UPI000ADA3C41|nr:hypothetical protein [Aquimarina aggregata]